MAPSVDHSKIKVEGENKESTGAKTIPYGSGDDINGATANENNEVGTIVTIRPADLEALQKLSELYQDCMEEKQIGFMAKYLSIRKFAICSLIGIFGLQLVGIPFFITQGNMTLTDAVLFSAYTITSAGLGSIKIPHTTGFLLGVVIYLYIGITSLAIVVAQIYQYWTFRTQRKRHARDKAEAAELGIQNLKHMESQELHKDPIDNLLRNELRNTLVKHYPNSSRGTSKEAARSLFRRLSFLSQEHEFGRFIKATCIISTPLLIMTFGMMAFEGWGYIEALYFSTYCMFTVGYGNYSPTHTASKWFVSVMLPFNILFVTIYLSSVAHYYVLLSEWNIRRIERSLLCDKKLIEDQRQVLRKLIDSIELSLVNPKKISDVNDSENLDEEKQRGRERRRLIRSLSILPATLIEKNTKQMITMRELIDWVHEKIEGIVSASADLSVDVLNTVTNTRVFGRELEKSAFLENAYCSSASYLKLSDAGSPPSLALRVLVQERFAQIIARDVTGFETSSEIKADDCLVFHTSALSSIAEKWQIPPLARSSFKSVAMQVLFFVGEHRLLTEGEEALFALNSTEFVALFMPLVVAMGDSSSMKSWIVVTNDKAAAFHKSRTDNTSTSSSVERNKFKGSEPSLLQAEDAIIIKPRRFMIETLDDYFPLNQGNACIIEQRMQAVRNA